MSVIHFKDVSGVIDPKYYPVPAGKVLPKWYKQMHTRLDHDDPDTSTIKKCSPVFDALSAGYIIPLPFDIEVKTLEDGPGYKFFAETMQFHQPFQASSHPMSNGFPFPKWMSPWSISTEPGYSVLFTTPMHHELPFKLFEGIVDTDNYIIPVNLPLALNDPKWEGIIYAGCPLVQVIPFKRDDFNMEISVSPADIEVHNAEKKTREFGSNSYKKQYWVKKDYK